MKSSYNKIYDKCPIMIQNILISLYGYKLFKQRYGEYYQKNLKHYSAKKYLSIKDEENLQISELQNLLSYAVENSPFYKKFYKDIDVKSIKSIEDLKKLPILEKEILRENINDVYTIKPEEGIKSFTGGTTGKSLMVIFRKEDFQKRMAYLDAFKSRHGVYKGSRTATFNGRQFINPQQKKKVFWRYNYILRQKLYSTFDMKTENLPYYIEDLNKFRPETLNGFVSAIYELAKYIKENNIALTFKPMAIFTTSETLLPIHRDLIETVFGCRVFDQYASAEGAPFICECQNGNLHYNLDTGIIELLNTQHGTEMLITSFTSYGTPLIRYRIGDKISFSNKRCQCGSCHPVVEKIEGRQVDYLISLERGKVSLSHLADVIKGMPNCIKSMQFIQNKIDEIDINIAIDENNYSSNYDNLIIDEMVYRFGENMKFNINKLKEIPREKSGKYRLVKNTVSKG